MVVDDSGDSETAIRLARQLGLPLLSGLADGANRWKFLLSPTQQGLALQLSQDRGPGPVRADLVAPALAYRVRDAVQHQAIAKAVGCKPGVRPTVLDGTAGLGKDAYLLASLGCQVLMLERDPIVHALLADGLARAATSDDSMAIAASQRLRLRHDDFLRPATPLPSVDVVYLDPMFPQRVCAAAVFCRQHGAG